MTTHDGQEEVVILVSETHRNGRTKSKQPNRDDAEKKSIAESEMTQNKIK